MGHTERFAGEPMFRVLSRNRIACSDDEGAVSHGKNVCGTYMHGMFDYAVISSRWLRQAGIDTEALNLKSNTSDTALDYAARKKRDYILLKEHFENHVTLDLSKNIQ